MARFVDAHLLAKAYLDVAREEHLTGLIFISPEDVANTILRLSEEFENVAPVVHAHWTGVTPMVDTIMCSNCGWNYPTNEFATPYCPSCGAKMDEEDS